MPKNLIMNRLKKTKTLLLAFFLCLSIFSNAQNTNTFSVKPDKHFLKSFWQDSKKVALAPKYWNSKQWIAAGVVVGGTFLLYQYDMEINNYFQSRQTHLGENLSKNVLEPFGSGLYSFPTLGLFYAQGMIWKNPRSQKVALMGAKAYIISGIFVQFPKFLINRHRPYHNKPSQHDIFEGPSLSLYKAFPSGHSTSVFAIAAVIASEYKSTIWVPIVSYTLASFSALSRIYDNKHWATDVFIGSVLGWSIGKLVYNSNNWKVKTYPMITPESAGLSFNYQF